MIRLFELIFNDDLPTRAFFFSENVQAIFADASFFRQQLNRNPNCIAQLKKILFLSQPVGEIDGAPCQSETRGLLKRVHTVAGEIRYFGKETDRKWEEGEDISVLDFAANEFGRRGKVVATEEVKAAIQEIGINKCARESGFDRKNFIRNLVRGILVKRNSYDEFLRWLNNATRS
jgi:hypothetical protein